MNNVEEFNFEKQNPQLTPEVMEKYRNNWKSIFKIIETLKACFISFNELVTEKKIAELTNNYDKCDEIAMKMWELNQMMERMLMLHKNLMMNVGANSQYHFELN